MSNNPLSSKPIVIGSSHLLRFEATDRVVVVQVVEDGGGITVTDLTNTHTFQVPEATLQFENCVASVIEKDGFQAPLSTYIEVGVPKWVRDVVNNGTKTGA
jgi:hypothetical protein